MHRATLPAAAAVLLGLLGLYWAGGAPPATTVESPEMALWPPFAPEDVVSIRFVDKDPAGTLLTTDGGAWILSSPGAAPVTARPQRARGMAAAIAGLTSVRRIEGDAPPSEYGLGPTALRIEAELADGSKRLLTVGDPLSVSPGRYVGVGEPMQVHLAPEMPLRLLLADPLGIAAPAAATEEPM